MNNITNKALLQLQGSLSTRPKEMAVGSKDTKFSTAYEFARIKTQLAASPTDFGATVQSSVTSLPLNSALSQNTKINNAAASLTGTLPSMHERALALRAYRQEILASNIANADTPNYKAIDIDIKEALKNGTPLSAVPIKYQTSSTSGIDGNTVDMDVERQKFAENALMYEFEVDKVKGKYKTMIDLLQNLPY